VDFDLYISTLRQFQVHTDVSIHYEYPLGGAAHGTTDLEISKEEFVALVRADLNFVQARLAV